MKPVRRSIAGIAAALTATGLSVLGLANAPAAHADPSEFTVSDAQFRWGINNESNGPSYFGGGNFFSAGKLGDPGEGSQLLKDADQGATWNNGATAGWAAESGNVRIEKKQADGSYAVTTWAERNTTVDGSPLGAPGGGTYSDHQIVIENGAGTADVDAGTASISWDGDATVVYYGGMTFWYLSDPELTVNADGTGELTATLGGYGSSKEDVTQWVQLTDTEVTLAEFEGLEVTENGVTGTPLYLEREVTTPDDSQVRTGPDWGAFPQGLVDFQQLTGQTSYWYSSGSALDAGKVATPFEVSYTADEPAPTSAAVTVSETELPATGEHQITVTGTGFDPDLAEATRAPICPLGPPAPCDRPGGAYVVFGKFAANWKPSAGATGGTRVNSFQQWAVTEEYIDAIGGPDAGAIELSEDGSFTATLTVDKAAIDQAATDSNLVNYGVYTYAGSGAVAAEYETYTPITFIEDELVEGNLRTAWGAKPTPSKAGRYTAKITGGGHVGVEKFTVEVTNVKGKVVDRRTSAAPDATGRAKDMPLRKQKPGTYTITVTYPGDDNLAAATVSEKFTVAKVKGNMRSAWVRKPTARRAGAITVKLTGAGVGPATGRFTVQVKNAKGKVLETRRPRLDKTGRAKAIPLKKRAAGKYAVVVSYPGNANLKASTLKVKFTAKRR